MDKTIIGKILNANKDTYVIFFVDECPFCQQALSLLRSKNVQYKGYNIHDINGDMPYLLEVLRKNADLIGFNTSHHTKPIIFYNKKFIGGYDELVKLFK
jgi:glutaredoxin